jgi:hypothetical protein
MCWEIELTCPYLLESLFSQAELLACKQLDPSGKKVFSTGDFLHENLF